LPVAQTIQIDEQVTVGSLAELLSLPASKLIAELFKNGVMATVNEKIDIDTAQIIAGELGLDVEFAKKEQEAAAPRAKRETSDSAASRPPVVAMMGHVDHGKTSLMDAIRGAEVVKGEAGGITQHLSAYQVKHGDRFITLLDTPGHEAFAALREHGARLTDVAVIVIAADDGIKPQTQEAIRYAQQAGVKIVVAANKMDKPEANIDRLKQQLAENNLLPEDWGGDTVIVPVSAKTKEGIPQLLDMIFLVSDLENLRADNTGPAQGIVIESHQEHGRGPVAVALVEQGTLKPGDFIAVGPTYGKVRNLDTTDGKTVKEAGPSTPVAISGFKDLPDFGDEFFVVANEKAARETATAAARIQRSGTSATATSGSELLRIISRSNKLNELNIVLKADVQGSLTSVVGSLKALDNEEVAVRVVSSGVGVISENDVHTAATAGAIIYGFNVTLPASIKQLASRDKVAIRIYNVIYELIDDVRLELEKLLPPEIIEQTLGELIVKGIFKTTRTEVICGGEVTSGKINIPSLLRINRGDELIADNLELSSLKRGPQDVKEVFEGEMCGLSFNTNTRVDIQEGDRITFFTRETRVRTL
jgi:translation initiation factor IF-2